MMRIGIAADHGGFELKVQLTAALKTAGYEMTDFGAYELVTGDDYPDFVVPLARLVQTFLSAHFKGAERFRRRLATVATLERT
jgi:ribose 5-phosphate isomerase RpiB